jgi:excinuclease UvrABC nuclease subunit
MLKHKTKRWVRHEIDFISLESIRPEPGCYVIIGDGKPVYIGQSTNLQVRVLGYRFGYTYGGQCRCQFGVYDTLHVKIRYSTRLGDWAMREIRLIARLRPSMNRRFFEPCQIGS